MYLLTTFARTAGAKDKKDRKKRILQITGGLAGTALLGALAYKNKDKLGKLFNKKSTINENPKQILALPAVGKSNSPVNKVKNELDDLFVETPKRTRLTNPSRDLNESDFAPNRVLTTPANMTKKEINSSKVAARKQALGKDLENLTRNTKDIKKGKKGIELSKKFIKQRTDIDRDKRAFVMKSTRINQRRRVQEQAGLKAKVKEKADNLKKSNPSLYHLNKLVEFSTRKQRKDKGIKRQSYNQLSNSVKEANTKMLYESYGGDKAANLLSNNKSNKLNKQSAKQYLRDIAAQFDKDNYEGNDVNKGLAKINKKYNKYFK